MDNKQLSICMPSNRNFLLSKESISSAIGFCEANNANLVISDNSCDTVKNDFWNKIELPNLIFDSNNSLNFWSDNWLNGIEKCKSKFTGIVSDDDVITNLGNSNIDYNNVAEDVVAIKPIISLWNEAVGIYKINNFIIQAHTPSERVLEYLTLAAGNNTTYFSFFRTSHLKEIYNLLKYHPTKGGYLDWAITITLIASGKIILDNSKLLVYKNTNWYGDKKYIDTQVQELFIRSKLQNNSHRFERVYRALDCFILLMRENSNLDYKEKLNVAVLLLEINIKLFKEYYENSNENFSSEEIITLKKLFCSETIKEKIDSCLELVSISNSFLKEKYSRFYFQSLGKEWGNI